MNYIIIYCLFNLGIIAGSDVNIPDSSITTNVNLTGYDYKYTYTNKTYLKAHNDDGNGNVNVYNNNNNNNNSNNDNDKDNIIGIQEALGILAIILMCCVACACIMRFCNNDRDCCES